MSEQNKAASRVALDALLRLFYRDEGECGDAGYASPFAQRRVSHQITSAAELRASTAPACGRRLQAMVGGGYNHLGAESR
jgi:hypothetical protein